MVGGKGKKIIIDLLLRLMRIKRNHAYKYLSTACGIESTQQVLVLGRRGSRNSSKIGKRQLFLQWYIKCAPRGRSWLELQIWEYK